MFTQFREELQKHFDKMTKDVDVLFEVNVDKDELWNLYLDSFPKGKNEIFRERREHDCSCCRHFIKTFGNVVVVKDCKVETLWDLSLNDDTYQPVCNKLAEYVRSKPILNRVVLKENHVGTLANYENKGTNEVIKWDHFYLDVPQHLVDSVVDAEYCKSQFRDTRNVFFRSLNKISKEAIETVLDLIRQGSLYRGNEWEGGLKQLLSYKEAFDSLNDQEAELFAWERAKEAGIGIGRIKNHSIGVLLMDISNGVDLENAVSSYEKIVAPQNYKRPKALFTKKMLENAKAKIEELGYMDSLNRRYAVLDDVSINNVLFSNKGVAKVEDDIFAEMEKSVSENPKKYARAEEMSIEDFINNVLPSVREIDVLFENRHKQNLVSLIAPAEKDAKTMFKWNNGFSWAYNGNVTDSLIKSEVKKFGGETTGALRFSIMWNDIDPKADDSDLDAHCRIYDKAGFYNEISFANRMVFKTLGELDIDIRHPNGQIAVENIIFSREDLLRDHSFNFYVHQFCDRGNKHGFRAEIEFDGNIYQYNYDHPIPQNRVVEIATVSVDDNGNFKIDEKLKSSTSTAEVWNISTNNFVPVSAIMLSPNYWDEQQGIGNKHYFFMLKDCCNPDSVNGFYNEFLSNELLPHRKVFEALGAKCNVPKSKEQISGLGFCDTRRNDLVVKVDAKRIVKIKF